jgi:hypothetical protein
MLQLLKVPPPLIEVTFTFNNPVEGLYAVIVAIIEFEELYAMITCCPIVYAKPVPIVSDCAPVAIVKVEGDDVE